MSVVRCSLFVVVVVIVIVCCSLLLNRYLFVGDDKLKGISSMHHLEEAVPISWKWWSIVNPSCQVQTSNINY